MALPALRATILLTTATVAAGTLLYENHEPFRTWADDVSGRAQAAWIGLKEDLKELRDDLGPRRETPLGAAPGPWRRGRGAARRASDGAHGDESRATAAGQGSDARDEKDEGDATGVWAGASASDGVLRRRRGSVHAGALDMGSIAAGAADMDMILGGSACEVRSRASTETQRSAEEEALHEAAMTGALTPTSTATLDVDDDAQSMSVVSAPSEMGVLTPTSSSAGEMWDFEELRRRVELSGSEVADRQDERMEDARSEVSGESEWGRVSEEPARA